jgi:hypothetical protein
MEENFAPITPFAFSFAIAMGILTLVLPRRVALLPLIIACSYMTLGQRILIFDKDINIFRILFLFGWARILFRGEIKKSLRFIGIDKAIICWVIVGILSGALVNTTVLVRHFGIVFNAIGLYFLFRFLIHDLDDIEILFKLMAIVIAPLAISMIIEKSTGRNIFSIFGGVPEMTMIRSLHEGATLLTRIRCQGPFRHPILAGTFGAVFMPFFIALWLNNNTSKLIPIIGITSASIIIVASASSGPIIAFVFVLVGFLIWPWHRKMRIIRWGILSSVIGLHLIMKDPVWHIFTRSSVIFGGTGWHRAAIIDAAIRHFREWWFVGTTYTAHWMPYHNSGNPDMADITNQYLWEGVSGGIVQMIMFIIIIVVSFRTVGLSLYAKKGKPFSTKIMIWSMGVALLAHVVTFFSVAYFDQMIVFWYLLLSMIAALPNETKGSSTKTKSRLEPVT